jgi:hypothetical protein
MPALSLFEPKKVEAKAVAETEIKTYIPSESKKISNYLSADDISYQPDENGNLRL